MRAWDVVWGSTRGSAVIQNSYVEVSDVVITSGESRIRTAGRFSIGYPRSDGGEEIDARIEITEASGCGSAACLHAGRLRPRRHVQRGVPRQRQLPHAVRFRQHGDHRRRGVRGAVRVGDGGRPARGRRRSSREHSGQQGRWTGNRRGVRRVEQHLLVQFRCARHPVETLAATKKSPRPVAGLLDFTAGGSGTFDSPRYDVRGTVRDLFVADEGIGQIVGNLSIDNDLMTVRLEAASPRLAVSASGRIALTPELDTELTISVSDTSLDPYVRAFQPQLSPYTTAVASGSIRVVGELANHRSSARGRHGRAARRPALRLRAPQRPTDPHRAGSPCRSCDRHAHRRAGYAARRLRAGQPPRFAHRAPCNRRCQPRGASGLCRRRAELGDGRAVGHARGATRGSRPSAARSTSPTAASGISRCRMRSRTSAARCGSIRAA